MPITLWKVVDLRWQHLTAIHLEKNTAPINRLEGFQRGFCLIWKQSAISMVFALIGLRRLKTLGSFGAGATEQAEKPTRTLRIMRVVLGRSGEKRDWIVSAGQRPSGTLTSPRTPLASSEETGVSVDPYAVVLDCAMNMVARFGQCQEQECNAAGIQPVALAF